MILSNVFSNIFLRIAHENSPIASTGRPRAVGDDEPRREKLRQKATTEKEKNKANHFSVRGVRRCTNAECAIFHNRDYNAAINIGIRCKQLLWPDLYPREGKDTTWSAFADGLDAELSALDAELNERF